MRTVRENVSASYVNGDISSSIAFSLQHIIEKTNGNLTIFLFAKCKTLNFLIWLNLSSCKKSPALSFAERYGVLQIPYSLLCNLSHTYVSKRSCSFLCLIIVVKLMRVHYRKHMWQEFLTAILCNVAFKLMRGRDGGQAG